MTTAEQNIESLVFTEGEIDDVIIQPLSQFCDKRGWLVELYRNDELPEGNAPVMAYVSETQPGVARGPHEHVEQSDYFAFIGPGTFKLYLWDTRKDSATFGCKFTALYGSENRAAVIIPPGVVHAYKNVQKSPVGFSTARMLFMPAKASRNQSTKFGTKTLRTVPTSWTDLTTNESILSRAVGPGTADRCFYVRMFAYEAAKNRRHWNTRLAGRGNVLSNDISRSVETA